MSARRGDNYVLRTISPRLRKRLAADLQRVSIEANAVLTPRGRRLSSVYFPTGAVISATFGADATEVRGVGIEGMLGADALLATEYPRFDLTCQIAGSMLSMPRALFRAHLSKSPEITFAVSAYSAKVLTLMTQSVACNALHTIGQRCARWLLVTGDRVDSATFVMTHKLVARMLGAHRPGISLALGRLQRLGLIEAGLGRIRILDRPGLEAESCECYRLVVRDVNGVFGARASRARG